VTSTPLRERIILLLENEPLVRYDIGNALRNAGATVLASRDAAEALAVMERHELSAAILNAGVGENDCSEVYQRLVQKSVPIVLHTGFLPAFVSPRWPKALVVTKPALRKDVIDIIQELCSSGAKGSGTLGNKGGSTN
jgi:CheY-like chemotaxis protein